ncbi:hypothetical protein Ocin01_17485 [Orchesella cincta]|uniref:PWWP domain-containing protein n=1 Tax=Orchesella cincta TaxID=48709 RepID=A0A1D2M881_ORCCI|nr:hypothetical protein Ocin01_17485 [Orchesella cincta]
MKPTLAPYQRMNCAYNTKALARFLSSTTISLVGLTDFKYFEVIDGRKEFEMSKFEMREGAINGSPEERSINPGTETSTHRQKQSEVEIIVKDEVEESKAEMGHVDVTDSPPKNSACSRSAAAQQSTPTVRRSKRPSKAPPSKDPTQPPSKDPSQRPPAKKAPRRQLAEKYFEGCLVLGKIDEYPHWPGMIRKAAANEDSHPVYACKQEGITWFFVQFFTKPTVLEWRIPEDMDLFNAAKEYSCEHLVPSVVEEYQKAIRIAKAAANFPVEERLAKFILPRGALIDNPLKEIDEWSGQALMDGCLPSGTQEGDGPPPSTQGTCADFVAQKGDGPVARTNGNGESCPDSVEIMMMERAAVYKQKLREESHREKNEEIRSLTNDKAKLADENDKLKATLKEQAKILMKEVEIEKEEKLKYKQETEKYKAAFEKVFPI